MVVHNDFWQSEAKFLFRLERSTVCMYVIPRWQPRVFTDWNEIWNRRTCYKVGATYMKGLFYFPPAWKWSLFCESFSQLRTSSEVYGKLLIYSFGTLKIFFLFIRLRKVSDFSCRSWRLTRTSDINLLYPCYFTSSF